MIKKVCVIGAGPSGLCAIRHSVAEGYEVVAFEKQRYVGGTWNYTDETGVDKNGIEVHSSMYESLMTNFPKEFMQYPGFPYPFEDRSFISSGKMLHYSKLFADEFDLRKHIKFEHQVVNVRPLEADKWEVIVCNIHDKKIKFFKFDAIIVCRGVSTPMHPVIPGRELFKGKQMHSHDYRKPQTIEGETVLLIGSGPSGIEMALEMGKFAKKVFWSHHSVRTYGRKINLTLPERVEERPDIRKLTENSVEFVDGTCEEITLIAYATGYNITFPFISVDCGISVDQKYVSPLYKHILNINRPTMAFINLTFFALGNPLYDLQVRFVLKFWRNPLIFPSKDQMYRDMINEEETRKAQNVEKRKFHLLGPLRHKNYYEQLATIAKIEGIPSVYVKGFDEIIRLLFENFNTYRNYNIQLIDDQNFRISE